MFEETPPNPDTIVGAWINLTKVDIDYYNFG